MGASGSVMMEGLNATDLANMAKDANCSIEFVNALRYGGFDEINLSRDISLLKEAIDKNFQTTEAACTTEKSPNLEIDFHGQTAAWYIRWALENKIPGYCTWMMKRRWAWSSPRNELEPRGWTFGQIQRGIIGCHFDRGYGYEPNDVEEWLSSHGETPGSGEALDSPETTGSVAYRLIKPLTSESKLTFRQTFLTGSEGVSKKATHFLSHSWSYPFWAFLEGLINHQLGYDRMWMYIYPMADILDKLDSLPVESVNYYWMDLFNKNQHIVTSDSTALELEQGIRAPGKVVLLLHPIPNWALSRVWCLFEVLISMQVEAQLSITYSFEMVDCFERQKINDGDSLKRIPWYSMGRYKNLPTVDAAKARATVESDRVYILDLIEKGVGIAKMNEMVARCLEQAFEGSSYGLGRKRPGEEGYVEHDPSSVVENEEADFNVILDEREGY